MNFSVFFIYDILRVSRGNAKRHKPQGENQNDKKSLIFRSNENRDILKVSKGNTIECSYFNKIEIS